ncbi:MAG: hypothetical protein KIT31_07595 [Deltaproteobacteria bacterium]|nr:hypothetical protein [Deltaproteobacteria bacterium]
MRAVLPILLLLGCGGSPRPKVTPVEAPKDPIPTTAGPACGVVGESVARIGVGKAESVAKSCTDDRWSDEARSCFAAAENDGELEGCSGKLTDVQKANLQLGPRTMPDGAKEPPAATMSAPPPPAGGTRAPAKKPKGGSDPCQGGE